MCQIHYHVEMDGEYDALTRQVSCTLKMKSSYNSVEMAHYIARGYFAVCF